MSTKQKILDTALDMFSKRGFSAVSVRDISYAVGVKESALYRHFKNKQDVFDTLVECYLKRSDSYFNNIGVLFSDDMAEMNRQADIYLHIDNEQFMKIASGVFTDFLLKPDVIMFWRMISIEQYSNPKMAEIFNLHLFDKPLEFQRIFFGILINKGGLKDYDPSILALEFYTPALILFLRILPFEMNHPIVSESLDMYKKHITNFRSMYFN